MKELNLPARLEYLDQVLSFLEDNLSDMGCSMRMTMKIQVAVEEVFVNIVSYAYPDRTDGEALILLEKLEQPLAVRITLVDSGIPYDPLAKPDPDVSLCAEDRPIGGLGIYMVKKTMDDVRYEYADGKNRLTLEMSIS